jgi:hypothetical protein
MNVTNKRPIHRYRLAVRSDVSGSFTSLEQTIALHYAYAASDRLAHLALCRVWCGGVNNARSQVATRNSAAARPKFKAASDVLLRKLVSLGAVYIESGWALLPSAKSAAEMTSSARQFHQRVRRDGAQRCTSTMYIRLCGTLGLSPVCLPCYRAQQIVSCDCCIRLRTLKCRTVMIVAYYLSAICSTLA